MVAPYFPIVLIRGFAATDANIEEASNQAFLGYEQGSTKTRQDAAGEIRPYFFESVVVRLMKDHGYDPAYRENQLGYDSRLAVPMKSIWLHRYYDLASKTYDGQRLPMEDYAKDLRRLILRIRDKVCRDADGGPDPAALQAFKVHLVAHSQGGLVARSYLQKICREPAYAVEPELRMDLGPLVASLFTYGTPHNGIEFLGQNVPDVGPLSWLQSRNFNRDVIRSYLSLSPAKRANDLDGALGVERTFCIIGTNWKDYDQPSKHVTRELSDGLVMCRNAYMIDSSVAPPGHSPRAYVSRAHGGPLGMVNSEEGYQNLRRFLFGDWRVDASVHIEGIRLPQNLVNELEVGQTAKGNYVLDVITSVRGQQVKLHERRNETASGVRFPVTYTKPADGGDTLFRLDAEVGADPQRTVSSLFMISQLSPETPAGQPGAMEFALQLTLEKPVFEIDKLFWIKEHIEGLATLRETFRIRLDPEAGVTYARIQDDALSVPHAPLSEPGQRAEPREFWGHIPFGPADDANLKPGEARGRINVRAYRRKVLD
jgi:pimeloyl-ACP methyl ester carboxylesterase